MSRQDDLRKLISLNIRRLQILKEQQAIYGISVEPRILIEIENIQAELATLQAELQQLPEEEERVQVSNKLYEAILRLDYQEQVNLFRQFVDTQRLGAFLIHGQPEHGQRWLLNRLLRQIPNRTTAKVIQIDLNRKTLDTEINALWRQLSGRVGLMSSCSSSEITQQVYRWWQTQNVILIFDNIDCMPEIYLNEFIRKFWLTLVNTNRDTAQKTKFLLLMFLIDYSGRVDTWNIPFAEQIDPARQPDVPIKLPLITPFAEDVLIHWIKNAIDQLPSSFTIQAEQTVRILLTSSENGIPERVIEQICGLCGCNWYMEENKWLIY